MTSGIPATAAGVSPDRASMMDEAMAEGELSAALAGLDEGFDVAQLREAVGAAAEGLSDDELMAEYQKASGQAAEESEEPEAEPQTTPVTEEPAFKLEGFKLYDDKGVEIANPAKVSVLDLLTGKVQIGYNALSKEQRKGLRDLTRVAANGHFNEQQVVGLKAERAQALQRAKEAEARVERFVADQKVWDRALTALANGNLEPMKQLATAYQKAIGELPATPSQPAAPEEDYEAIGQEVFTTHIAPRAQELATQYNANPIEVAQYIMWLVEQEGEFLTPEKVESILKYEMPSVLESKGFVAGQPAAAPTPKTDPRDAQIAEMQKQIAALTAAQANAKTQKLRTKRVPPVGNGQPSGAETVPVLNSRDDMKKYLRGE